MASDDERESPEMPETAYETLRWALRDGVAVVTLARPEQGNALSAQMKADLVHALRRAGEEARAVMITGAGAAFCAGQDLGGDAPNLAELDMGRSMREETRPLLEAMEACAVPTLAAVNGAAAGAGLALALAADIVLAAERAEFAVISPRLGLPPDAGLSWALPRLIGPARARGLCLLGEAMPARRAAAWGLIWDCLPDAGFVEAAEGCARRLAAGPPIGQRLTRAALREGAETPWFDQLEREADLLAEAGASRDFLEGVMAWREGRPPRFEGR